MSAVTPLPRILVVEDEPDVARLIKHALEQRGEARGDIAATGGAALKRIGTGAPDLLLLDLTLPLIDGAEVCRLVLDLGADDYITKSFSLREDGRARPRNRRPRVRMAAR
jgi:DNA-binding response OmpR family regulator